MLTLPAYAKINLVLEVLGKREDGYHQVATVMQTISLQDTLSFDLARERISLECDIPEMVSPDNLVLRAAYLLREATGCRKGARISLEKRIPPASGLGGGSSDAATTLKALDGLWELYLTPEELMGLAIKLGSDVPFFVGGGTCLVEGRGEKVTPLPPLPHSWLVLLRPPLEVARKTAQLYARLLPEHFSGGEQARKLAEFLRHSRERGIKGVRVENLLYNVFERVAFSFFPGVEEFGQLLVASGAADVHLAGSGPTLFALVSDQAQGEQVCSQLKPARGEIFLVNTVPGTGAQ